MCKMNIYFLAVFEKKITSDMWLKMLRNVFISTG